MSKQSREAAKTDTDAAPSPHSIFPKREKRLYVWIASLAAFTSPVAGSIYFPALNVLAADLHTSVSNINLTITTYMVGGT